MIDHRPLLLLTVANLEGMHIFRKKYFSCLSCEFMGAGRASDSESRCPGLDPHRHHCVVSLSKTHQLPTVLVKKVQVGKDQKKAQSERDSHSKNRGRKQPN